MSEVSRSLNPGAPRRRAVAGLVLAAVFLFATTGSGQEPPAAVPSPGPTPTPTPAPTPIPAAEISDQVASTAAMLRTAMKANDVLDEIAAIEDVYEKERQHLDELAKETSRRLEINGPASVLEETQKTWKRIEVRLDEWQKTLKDRAGALDALLLEINQQRAIWQLTLSSTDQEGLPPEVRGEVVDILKAIDDTDTSVRASRDKVLTLQSRISKSKSIIAETLAVQREEILNRRRGIVGIDSPTLWRAFSVPGVDGGPSEQISAMWERNSQSVREYAGEDLSKLIRHVAFVIAFAFGLMLLRRKAELWAQQDRSLDRTVRVLDRPVSASLIVTILLGDLLHPEAPAAWLDVLGLVLVFALLRVLPSMVSATLQPMAYLLALLYFLEQATRLAPDGNLVDRLLLLALSSTAAAMAWWVDRRLADRRLIDSQGWRRATRTGTRLAFAAFGVASLANIFGAVGFATLVTEGTLTSVFAAILIWVSVVLSRAVIRVVLLTQTAKKLGIVRSHADAVRTTLFKIITWGGVTVWVVWTLKEFKLFDVAKTWLIKVLGTEVSFGQFTWVPGTVVLFVLVVWLSFKLSQLIRFGLETDFLPRLDLPRGVPGAISKVTHYIVIVVGVLIAATAAGVDFSRINLIIGALGVGIGFGLQNVVSNFVSGLILLFERPVRVDDRVEIGPLSGVVTDIGMRASVVRTWQGAEVIVPNANLISSEVINWTLSDDSHRIEVPVGVAYGTEPRRVLDLLTSVARNHSDVFEDPEPVVLFLGFGDSSLDFELRAWTGPDFVRVASEIRLAVHEALSDAGIEIPFPQRDVHLRTGNERVAVTASESGREGRASREINGENE